jgi:hypothetical protein
MATAQRLALSIVLPYPQADVEFRLSGTCQDGTAPSLEITATRPGSEHALALQHNAVPVLEDFAPGFARWLRTCQVTAEIRPTSIHGTMLASATATQLLEAMRRASDMIDQRFALYTESILE